MSTLTAETSTNGATVRDLRKAANYTTRKAGTALGVSHVRVSQIEHSGTDSVDMIQAMADLYGVSFEVMRQAVSLTKSS